MSDEDVDKLKRDIIGHIDSIMDNTSDDDQIDKLNDIRSHILETGLDDIDEDQIKYYKKVNRSLGFFDKLKESLESEVDIDPGRIFGLSDGIFGMVMTLLVFGMALPEAHLLTSGDFVSFIYSIAPIFGYTIVSFVLVSSFWVYYHEFVKINNLNMPFLWLNIIFLACISFIPFTTSLIGTYSHFFFSEVIFGMNIFLTLSVFLLMVSYAHKKGFLIKKLSRSEKRYINNTFFMMMFLTVIVNLLDFNISSNFIYLFLLVPVISTLRDITFKMKS